MIIIALTLFGIHLLPLQGATFNYKDFETHHICTNTCCPTT